MKEQLAMEARANEVKFGREGARNLPSLILGREPDFTFLRAVSFVALCFFLCFAFRRFLNSFQV